MALMRTQDSFMKIHDKDTSFTNHGSYHEECDDLCIPTQTKQECLDGTNFVHKNVCCKNLGKQKVNL